MIDILEYIKLEKHIRQSHLNLDESCVEIGGNSTQFKGLLAYYLQTTIPKGNKVQLCHACHNGKCSNVKHLYWGTPKENSLDKVAHQKLNNTYISVHDRTKAIYGENYIEKHNEHLKSIASKGGKANKNSIRSEEHKRKIRDSVNKYYNSKRVQYR
jgi:hypothetical protein